MKSFEAFMASRKEMDPSTQKLTEPQWRQAYAAYRSSRERVGKRADDVGSTSSGSSKRRRRKEVGSSGGGRGPAEGPAEVSGLGVLKMRIREQSGYADLRGIIDVVAWVAIAVIVVIALLSAFGAVNVYSALTDLAGAGLEILVVFVVRLLAHVIVDIPDIALYKVVAGRGSKRESQKAEKPLNQ